MSLALKAHLFKCYGSFSDKRVKNVEKGRTFIGDSRENHGIASDGSLYGWFCGILVDVVSDEEVTVTLYGSIPSSPAADVTIRALGGDPTDDRVYLSVRPANLPLLRRLAAETDAIVAPGRRYSTPGFKYMCPRTADSLSALAGYLDQFWAVPRPALATTGTLLGI